MPKRLGTSLKGLSLGTIYQIGIPTLNFLVYRILCC